MSRRQAALADFDAGGDPDPGAGDETVVAPACDGDSYHRPLAPTGAGDDMLACRPQAPRGDPLPRRDAEARDLTPCRKCWPSDDPAENGYVPPSPQDRPRHGRAGRCTDGCCDDDGGRL